MVLAWIAIFVVLLGGLLIARSVLWVFTFAALCLVVGFCLNTHSLPAIITLGVLWIILFALNLTFLRRYLISFLVFKLYRKVMPMMSPTEKEALAAGTVGYEGEFFTGQPDWDDLFVIKKSQLTEEEQAFLDGPVETLYAIS